MFLVMWIAFPNQYLYAFLPSPWQDILAYSAQDFQFSQNTRIDDFYLGPSSGLISLRRVLTNTGTNSYQVTLTLVLFLCLYTVCKQSRILCFCAVLVTTSFNSVTSFSKGDLFLSNYDINSIDDWFLCDLELLFAILFITIWLKILPYLNLFVSCERTFKREWELYYLWCILLLLYIIYCFCSFWYWLEISLCLRRPVLPLWGLMWFAVQDHQCSLTMLHTAQASMLELYQEPGFTLSQEQ